MKRTLLALLVAAIPLLVVAPSGCVVEPLEEGPDASVDAGGGTDRDAGVDAGGLIIGELGPHTIRSGENVIVRLTVMGGQAPFEWRDLERAPELAWAELARATGEITGVAGDPYSGDRAMRVEVREQSTGRTAIGDVLIRVAPCANGDKRPCEQQGTQSGCYIGDQLCVNGEWAASCEGERLSDVTHLCGTTCGACGDEAMRCAAGQCVCGSSSLPCQERQACCADGDGQTCKDVDTDVMNCGACKVICQPAANASPICDAGVCATQCDGAWARCGDQANGRDCNTDTLTEEAHCGACDRRTPDAGSPGPAANQHYTGFCVEGDFEFECDPGWQDCDGNLANGCESFAATDLNHCGGCGNVCDERYRPPGSEAIGFPTCGGGQCGWNCGTEGRLCEEQQVDSCKRYTNIDHCGQCNNACTVDASKNVASVTCASAPAPTHATCEVTTCVGFWRDCDLDVATGCELDSTYDENNCGACGNKCALGWVCNTGTCESIEVCTPPGSPACEPG